MAGTPDALFLGLDCGTQSTKAVVLDGSGAAVARASVAHDRDISSATRDGVVRRPGGEVLAPIHMVRPSAGFYPRRRPTFTLRRSSGWQPWIASSRPWGATFWAASPRSPSAHSSMGPYSGPGAGWRSWGTCRARCRRRTSWRAPSSRTWPPCGWTQARAPSARRWRAGLAAAPGWPMSPAPRTRSERSARRATRRRRLPRRLPSQALRALHGAPDRQAPQAATVPGRVREDIPRELLPPVPPAWAPRPPGPQRRQRHESAGHMVTAVVRAPPVVRRAFASLQRASTPCPPCQVARSAGGVRGGRGSYSPARRPRSLAHGPRRALAFRPAALRALEPRPRRPWVGRQPLHPGRHGHNAPPVCWHQPRHQRHGACRRNHAPARLPPPPHTPTRGIRPGICADGQASPGRGGPRHVQPAPRARWERPTQ